MKIKNKKVRAAAFSAAFVVCLTAAFFIYTAFYYRADETAFAALVSDKSVTVTKTEYGYFFDGEGTENALVFYPGGKVETEAYAPLMKKTAEKGIDAFLVEMPLRLAIFAPNKADNIIGQGEYKNYYIGGHSLGGYEASLYAARHSEDIAGVIWCASYTTKDIPESERVLSVYGTNDGVMRSASYEKSKSLVPSDFSEVIIEGGNHSNFGSYGKQQSDNEASITAEEQQRQAADEIARFISSQSEKE